MHKRISCWCSGLGSCPWKGCKRWPSGCMTIFVDTSMVHCMPMRRSLHASCFNIHLLMLDVLQSIGGNAGAPMPAFFAARCCLWTPYILPKASSRVCVDMKVTTRYPCHSERPLSHIDVFFALPLHALQEVLAPAAWVCICLVPAQPQQNC